MAITRLERKGLRNVSRAKRKKRIIKSLCKVPVIKNVDLDTIKKEFDLKSKTKSDKNLKKKDSTDKKKTQKKTASKNPRLKSKRNIIILSLL